MMERDLFDPVKDHFLAQGYAVGAEVGHCDLVARKDDELVIVELKTGLTLKLLAQAVDRQRITQQVYVATPAPARENRQFRATARVVRRLGLGMLLVTEGPLGARARERHKPSHDGKPVKRMREALLREFDARRTHMNVGGVARTPIMTAYRETAICIATLLSVQGPLAPKQAARLFGRKSGSILYANHYGWFTRIAPGLYDLTEEGKVALDEYAPVRDCALEVIRGQATECP